MAYYTERMQPRPLPRLVRPAGEGAGLHPLAVILVLLPFLLLIPAGIISVRHEALQTDNVRLALAGVSAVFLVAALALVLVLPPLTSGLRSSLTKPLADRAARRLTRSGAGLIGYLPIWLLGVFLVSGLSGTGLPAGPFGITFWALAFGAVACLVCGRFFEKIGKALEGSEGSASPNR